VEARVLEGLAHLALGDQRAAGDAAEAALAAAEPDRLIFPFALFAAGGLLDALPQRETAHSALAADIDDLLRGRPPRPADQAQLTPLIDLSPTELRVLRYLPTNLTRPDIARTLGISVNTVSTHVRNIYAKLKVSDRTSAVQRARDLRLLGLGRLPSASE
jgi:LuxR family maltose regulon positive regulatory protein